MIVGIDLSVLQTPHRMRGIGYTIINFINHLPDSAKAAHRFVFYVLDDDESPLDLLDLNGVEFEMRTVRRFRLSSVARPGRMELVGRVLTELRKIRDSVAGHSRMGDLSDLDVLLQFDQSQPLPPPSAVRSVVIAYDIIPYVLEHDYLWSYRTTRGRGRSRTEAVRRAYLRRRYAARLQRVSRNAARVIAISAHTKRDLVMWLGIDDDKVTVCHLGVTVADLVRPESVTLQHWVSSTWGPRQRDVDLTDEKFLLYVGGVDPRRRLSELVAAFNNLRAQGTDIKLVLTGDTMTGANQVPNAELQQYLRATSYLDDILFMGFVDDHQREWLYEHAVAFVYPSVYEGFGLPVIEAMRYGTPVTTFDNSSIREIAGDAALYARDHREIASQVERLLHDDALRVRYSALGRSCAARYSWAETSSRMLELALGSPLRPKA